MNTINQKKQRRNKNIKGSELGNLLLLVLRTTHRYVKKTKNRRKNDTSTSAYLSTLV